LSPRRISLADLLSATGYKQRDLWDLRRRGLFPFKAEHTHIPGHPGSMSGYPIEALDYLRRLAEVQRQFPRKADEWYWRMWHDPADWQIDMRAWVLARLDRLLDKTMRAKAGRAILEPGAVRRFPGAGRVRNPKSRGAAVDWMLAWTLGNERPALYSAAPEGVPALSFFDLLLRFAGPPFEGLPVFRFSGLREQLSQRGGPYWLTRFRRITAKAPSRYIEQARRDWRSISNLIEAAERVDWKKVPAFTAIDAKPEPPSWASRKARRTRPKPPPDIIKLSIQEWRRSFDLRALLFGALLTARRLLARSSMGQLPDVMLVIALQWLEGLPQLHSASRPQA
jgi:hypothetical protein